MTSVKLDKEELKALLNHSKEDKNASTVIEEVPQDSAVVTEKQTDHSKDDNITKNNSSSLNTSQANHSGLNPFSNDAEREEAFKETKQSDIDPVRIKIADQQLRENGYDHLPKEVYAGFWVRLAAYIVDYLFILLLTNLITNIVGEIDREIFWGILPMFFNLAVFCLYFFLMTLALNGQTPGKVLFNLRVVPINNQSNKLNLSTLVIRELFGKVIFYYVPIIAVILIFTSKHQHPLDMLSDTAVINERYLNAFAKWKLA
ncbi:RDD family protein [Facklamia sp. 7083-14-GEN3]|uniref:RDD family protein n=1 Tax=Facklamia sp. 7083-14-GEN3 TaxID=2973478 RepID=UPI00215BEBEB|nr:RDD family protein [Facklamia sp. 7083-14-GEN3]MCR8969214.1 RDD family protein [Facklamia sp. 7083-14-GEN3]